MAHAEGWHTQIEKWPLSHILACRMQIQSHKVYFFHNSSSLMTKTMSIEICKTHMTIEIVYFFHSSSSLMTKTMSIEIYKTHRSYHYQIMQIAFLDMFNLNALHACKPSPKSFHHMH